MGQRIGNKKHELILKITIKKLREQGYSVISLDGKSPSIVTVKNNRFYAFIASRNHNRTITEIEDTYYMFNRVYRFDYPKKIPFSQVLQNQIMLLQNDGYKRVVPLHGKSPDAIATKDNKIYAIEILGFCTNDITNMQNKQVKDKRDIYDMFDGVMIRTFKTNSEELEYFTEYYGGNSPKFHSPQRGLGDKK